MATEEQAKKRIIEILNDSNIKTKQLYDQEEQKKEPKEWPLPFDDHMKSVIIPTIKKMSQEIKQQSKKIDFNIRSGTSTQIKGKNIPLEYKIADKNNRSGFPQLVIKADKTMDSVSIDIKFKESKSVSEPCLECMLDGIDADTIRDHMLRLLEWSLK